MTEDTPIDHYEILQVSCNADPETIHRVYRLMAQRFHPDNHETGNTERFRLISRAYDVLKDPERRAQFDIVHQQEKQSRRRLVSEGVRPENDFQLEQAVRLAVLEVLYTRRRLEPQSPGIFVLDLEDLVGQPREHLDFTLWYLAERELVKRGDNARILITADGVDYLEKHYQQHAKTPLLRARSEGAVN